MKLPVSVVIVARDEEKVIAECLRSVEMCAEVIVVVDNRSTDETTHIAHDAGATVFTEKFVDFSQIKNFALAKAKEPWTLLLDADERVSSELAESIKKATKPMQNSPIGFLIAFRNHLRGKWLQHGGMYPDYHLRFFKTKSAHYTGAIHEKLVIEEGPQGVLGGDIIHMTYPSAKILFRKVRKYAELEAIEYPKKSTSQAVFHAAKRFIGVYFFRRGILDGINGLINAIALAEYQYILYKPLS